MASDKQEFQKLLQQNESWEHLMVEACRLRSEAALSRQITTNSSPNHNTPHPQDQASKRKNNNDKEGPPLKRTKKDRDSTQRKTK